MEHATALEQPLVTRLRPSTRLLRDVPPFQPWMLSRYGLALPMTSCDADLYATIYEQSKDGAGAFSESMTAFAATHGFSSHTVTAARRRLQAAGLIDYVLDDDGNRVSLARPGKPVYLYRANLEIAFEAENRFHACMPENLAAIKAAVCCTNAHVLSSSLPAPNTAPVVHEAPAADPVAVDEAETLPEMPVDTVPSGCLSVKEGEVAPSPREVAAAPEDSQADDLMWVFTSCYPKAQRALDEAAAEKVKHELAKLACRLDATKEEVQEACMLRRREARANNPELFDGTTTEAQKWKFLPSALDFVARPQGLAAAIMSVRMNSRESTEKESFSAVPSNNVATSPHVPPHSSSKSRTVTNTDARALCEAILEESTYNRAGGYDDLWFATCPHGINGSYQSWQMTAHSKEEAVSDHRRQVETALGLSKSSCLLDLYAEEAPETCVDLSMPPTEPDAGDVAEPVCPVLPTPQVTPQGSSQTSPQQAWDRMVSDIVSTRPALAAALEGSWVVSDDGSCLQVAIPERHAFYLHVLTREKNSSDISSAVAAALGPREVRFSPRATDVVEHDTTQADARAL